MNPNRLYMNTYSLVHRRARRLFAILAIMACLPSAPFSTLLAQSCVMACPPNVPPVPISLSAACDDLLTYELLGVVLSNCPGDIVVSILDNDIPIGDHITADMIGQTYMAIISHPASGQSCMTEFTVLDKQAPVVTCPADVTLACNADLDAYVGLSPDDVDDCSAFTIYKDDVLIASGNCIGDIVSQYQRTYIIVDIYNNADTCTQLISLEKASLGDVVFPADLSGPNALSCSPPPGTTPDDTGYPTVDGNPILNGSFCNLSATWLDLPLPICSGSYKIHRHWTVTDWCAGNSTVTALQVIEVLDDTAPVVIAPADVTISTDPTGCTASYSLPPAAISDDCSTSWEVRMSGPFGTIHSNGGFITGLPEGVHEIRYIATNDCFLEGNDTMHITVQDLQPPVPVCHQTVVIPVNQEGYAVVPADVFNAASEDNCGDVYFKVKRMSPPAGYTCANPGNPENLFDDVIQFCCADIAHNNIMVILRVYDVPPVPGPVSDTYLSGHFNDCLLEVEVQDKLPPQIICPSDLTISCQYPFTLENLDVFGSIAFSEATREEICFNDPGNPGIQCPGLDGLATDDCQVEISESADLDIDNCGTGTLVRTFTATDAGGLQAICQQTITIINYDLFSEADITWPADFTTSDICDISALDPEDLDPPYNAPVLQDGPCDLVSATYSDLVFDLTNDDQACFKILRTWTVADWCQLNTQQGGTWTHMQVIKVMNSEAPVIEPLANIIECSYDANCGGLTLDFEAAATDDCSGPSTLSWRYFIDENDDAIFEDISGVQTGASVQFSRYMPLGTHRILFSVWDQCGNTTNAEQYVTIESCKGPSAKCIHGLSTNLMGMDTDGDGTADWGMVVVRADMFDAGSDHPCGNPITLSFSSNPNDDSRVFDCTQLGTNEIELWAIDQNGLTDFCVTTLEVQDNTPVCPQGAGGGGTISGNITVPGAGKLGGAQVHLEGSSLEDVTTTPDGYFVFPTMPFGGSYTVRPERTGDDKNGVTTLDLVHIQKHLLGIQTFQDPYAYIAADANNSQSITAIDILQLRKLILGLDDALPNNASWRFVDRAHIFPDPHNPWASAWPETYRIEPFAGSMNEVDFDAVKIGDLNGSAALNASGGIVLPRSATRAKVDYQVQPTEDGEVYKVDIFLTDASLYQAVQFSFNWDQQGYQLMDWTPGAGIQREDIRMPATPGMPASLAATQPQGWTEDRLLLTTLWVKPVGYQPVFHLFLAAQPTAALAYALEGDEERTLYLEATGKLAPVAHNRPNPFRDMTTIVIESHQADQAMLRVMDMNGRVVLTRLISLVHGKNEVIVRRPELGGPGIYQYEIESDKQYTTNRMIIVE